MPRVPTSGRTGPDFRLDREGVGSGDRTTEIVPREDSSLIYKK